MKRLATAFAAFLLLATPSAFAETIKVVSSGGFAAAYKELIPAFEKRTGHTVVSEWGPSMGATKDAVPQRLARNEDIDVLIM
ncbi:substrate-binding domain-containing protein, partial [Acinetobacter baumannii]